MFPVTIKLNCGEATIYATAIGVRNNKDLRDKLKTDFTTVTLLEQSGGYNRDITIESSLEKVLEKLKSPEDGIADLTGLQAVEPEKTNKPAPRNILQFSFK